MRRLVSPPRVAAALPALVLLASASLGMKPAPALVHAPVQEPSVCPVESSAVVAPSVLGVGETAAVTLTLTANCPRKPPAHVVFVLDASSRMMGTPKQDMLAAFQAMVEVLDFQGDPPAKAAVVAFSVSGETLCPLSRDEAQVLACGLGIHAEGYADIEIGLQVARDVLVAGRGGLAPDELREVVVLISQGANYNGCPPVLQAGGELKSGGALVMSMCAAGEKCDSSCVRRTATSPRYYFTTDTPELAAETLAAALAPVPSMQRANLTAVLPTGVRFVADPADGDVTWDPSTRTASWRDVYAESVVHAFRVVGTTPGTFPVMTSAQADIVDAFRRTLTVDFDVPDITVNAIASTCPIETSASVAPSTLRLGETAQVTFTIKADCRLDPVRHLAIVLDGSGGMGGAPSQEMKAAARAIVQRLDLRNNPTSEVAVIEFNSDARTRCALTNEEGRAVSCVMAVGANGGSNVSAGLRKAVEELAAGRDGVDKADLREVVLLISGGRDTAGCPSMLTAADEAKSQGVLLTSMCVADCDQSCMRSAATSPRYFFTTQAVGEVSTILFDLGVIRDAMRDVAVSGLLPEGLDYAGFTAGPPPTWHPAPRALSWTNPAADDIELTFLVSGERPGTWPVLSSFGGTFVDPQDRPATFVVEAPEVTVLADFGAVFLPYVAVVKR